MKNERDSRECSKVLFAIFFSSILNPQSSADKEKGMNLTPDIESRGVRDLEVKGGETDRGCLHV